MLKCAEAIKKSLLDAGCSKAEVMTTDGHPVVYGERIIDPSKPTVLVYGHYDVQTVMGHEVAHALQRHGAERMSRSVLEQIGQLAALVAGAAAGRPDAAKAAMTVYGVGVSLPFDRRQESEADFIGLRLMAEAGYDPREAVAFWERMSGCPRAMTVNSASAHSRPFRNFSRPIRPM